jgi:hypothetical protein
MNRNLKEIESEVLRLDRLSEAEYRQLWAEKPKRVTPTSKLDEAMRSMAMRFSSGARGKVEALPVD